MNSEQNIRPEALSNITSILSTAYLGPVSYYKQIVNSRNIIIEQYDNYIKQTYRNRCKIATSNNMMDLSIPINKTGNKCITKDIRIAYTENWQQIHWRAIESAYSSSPFFEYYRDDLEPFFHKKTAFLIDLNILLQETVLNLLDISIPITVSKEYLTSFLENEIDLRDSFHPKKEFQEERKPYYQVFEQKFGFQKDLSIIDLIFNMGPEAIFFL